MCNQNDLEDLLNRILLGYTFRRMQLLYIFVPLS